MLRFLASILFLIYDYFRYKINLSGGKDIDKSLFNKLNDNLKKNLIVIKKECKENLLIASFVHQAGYIYTDCLIANYLAEIKNLNIIGLMCIPPKDGSVSDYFKELKNLNKRHNLNELSMGMSQDYLDAANIGATYLRIGSEIFGSRS